MKSTKTQPPQNPQGGYPVLELEGGSKWVVAQFQAYSNTAPDEDSGSAYSEFVKSVNARHHTTSEEFGETLESIERREKLNISLFERTTGFRYEDSKVACDSALQHYEERLAVSSKNGLIFRVMTRETLEKMYPN